MNDIIAKGIVDSVHDIAVAFLGIEITKGPLQTKSLDSTYQPPNSEATAHIGLSGGLSGGLFLSAPQQVAVYLAGALQGEAIASFNAEAMDGFGELANMIAGHIQTVFSEEEGAINLTPPSIIGQGDHQLNLTGYLHSVRQFFKTDEGMFFAEVYYA